MEMLSLSSLTRLYVEVFGADLLRYVLGAGGVYLVLNLFLAAHLSAQKIRSAGPVPGQIFRELKASLRTVAIFAATGTSIGLASRAGLIDIYGNIAERGWVYFAVSIIVLIVAHDAWFYWSHRLLHHRTLFRRFHRLHHRSHNPTPFTSYSFDVGEAFANALFLPLILLVLPSHPVALLIFVTHMMLRNALGHCGIEIFPARPDGRPVFGWLTSVTHHDLHHANGKWNMGLYFTWWDRWMGTEHPDYLKRFGEVAPRISLVGVRVILLMAVALLGLVANPADAFELKGRYATPGLGAIISFDACNGGTNNVCARLDWVWDSRNVKGVEVGDILSDSLRFDGKAWIGSMINPENGWTFKGEITAPGHGKLAVKGCAGPICVRQSWYSTTMLIQILDN